MTDHLAVLEELAKVFADEAEAMLRGGYESRLCGYKVRGMAERLTAAIALMRGQSWQDIATIPDTGSPEFPFGVLVADGKGRVFTAHCSRSAGSDFYMYSGQFRITGATHWQPLPAPPKDPADEQ